MADLDNNVKFSDLYEVLHIVGSGGQGQVFKAIEKSSGKTYAAKRITINSWDEIGKLEAEVKALRNLKGDHIPRFKETFIQKSDCNTPDFYLVTDFIDGMNFSKRIKQGERFTEAQLRDYEQQTLEALTEAHSKGIVHRDIKPSNLILSDSGQVYVTDFGLAKFLGEKSHTNSGDKGSAWYMAPEQENGGEITPETDYYPLGLTLTAIASGEERNSRSLKPKEQIAKLSHLSDSYRRHLEFFVSEDPLERRKGLEERTEIVKGNDNSRGAIVKVGEDKGLEERIETVNPEKIFETIVEANKDKGIEKWSKKGMIGGGLFSLGFGFTGVVCGYIGDFINYDFYAALSLICLSEGAIAGIYVADQLKKYFHNRNANEIVTVTGNLKDAYNKIIPGTMQHVDELMKDRITNTKLRSNGFYTADGELYFIEDDKTKLAITREADNLVLKNIDNAYEQLVHNKNYYPSLAEAQQSIHAENTVVIDLTRLRLEKHNEEFSYLKILTRAYNHLNGEERTFAERVYGKGTDFGRSMNMLFEAGISETKIWVLNPQYVTEKAKDSPVGRASWLNDFVDNSLFGAGGRNISFNDRVRGVRR